MVDNIQLKCIYSVDVMKYENIKTANQKCTDPPSLLIYESFHQLYFDLN